jgi:hypothetical protein
LPADPPIVQAIPGCLVTRVAVDDSFTVTLCGIDREVVLRIDGAGEAAGTPFDPDRDPLTVAPLLHMLNRRVDAARIEPDGGLVIDIQGRTLRVFPSDHVVSWSMRGPDGMRASCLAEGKVVWQ